MDKHLNYEQKANLLPRLLARVTYVGGCWLWTGPVSPDGYARIRVCGDLTKWAIHRAAYEIFIGPIPDGLTIDHLCRRPSCINPTHLEPVSMRVNIERGFGVGMKNRGKSVCASGHPYTTNTCRIEKIGNGKMGRRCVICRRERERRNWHARKLYTR